jgi:hypothetical protein
MTTVRVLLALRARQRGDHAQAESFVATVRADISDYFTGSESREWLWYDRAFTRVLLKKADSLSTVK